LFNFFIIFVCVEYNLCFHYFCLFAIKELIDESLVVPKYIFECAGKLIIILLAVPL